MDHHGLYTDISNSFPGSGVLPNTTVKYHSHLPQIPPQPPPVLSQSGSSQIFIPPQQQPQQQVQASVSYSHQQPQVQQPPGQQQHVESDSISGLFPDAAGLFDTTNALCTNNINSNSFSNSNSNQGLNSSKSIEFTSRKFETNTGDSITYNINNINTNIVNNITGGTLGTTGVQGINQAQAAIVGGQATSDYLGNTQFATSGGGNSQISFNKEGDSNPTIINISNNNHNIMAAPYPYAYPTKISGMGALNELSTKFGAGHSWSSASGAAHTTVGEFGHDNAVISNFESKNPNKYHTSRSSYRYQQDYAQAAQQPQTPAHYQHKQPQPTAHYQHSYGLYHPEGAQATPIHQPSSHHGYEPYPHIVRSKYPTMDDASRYGRSHQLSSANHSQSHHDLMYNERSRYQNSYSSSGYVPPAPGSYYTSHQTSSKSLLNANVDYYNTNYLKQMSAMSHPAANIYLPNRHTYPSQISNLHNYHHSNYPINHNTTYEDPYHHRSRLSTIPHHFSESHLQQAYTNYSNATASSHGYPTNQKLTFTKNINDFYAPNVSINPSHHYPANPTAPTVHHPPHHYGGIKYTSQTIVPPLNQTRPAIPTSQHSSSQKPTATSCYYDTPNPIIDMNHPLIDLEEQINSVKILKTNRDTTFEANHALNYDCQQKYMLNRYMQAKTSSSSAGLTRDSNGYIPNGMLNAGSAANPTNYGYTTLEDLGLGPRSFTADENLKDKSLRDYLTNWNETEEEENGSNSDKREPNNNQVAHQNFDSCKYLQEALEEHLPPLHSGVIVANVQNGNLPDILIDLEKTTKDEEKSIPAQEETEVGEKLYILETYDVPHSELNKYKHLSVINELPKNVVPIHDSADSLKFLEEIESNRDKYYQTELESEVVYDDRRKEEDNKDSVSSAEPAERTIPKEEAPQSSEPATNAVSIMDEVKPNEAVPEKVETKLTNELTKNDDGDTFKVPRYMPKYRKRREYYNHSFDYPRFPKKARRSSIEDFLYSDRPKPKVQIVKKNPRTLLTLCVAALNSREFRKYAKADITRRKELNSSKDVQVARDPAENITVKLQPEKRETQELQKGTEIINMDKDDGKADEYSTNAPDPNKTDNFALKANEQKTREKNHNEMITSTIINEIDPAKLDENSTTQREATDRNAVNIFESVVAVSPTKEQCSATQKNYFSPNIGDFNKIKDVSSESESESDSDSQDEDSKESDSTDSSSTSSTGESDDNTDDETESPREPSPISNRVSVIVEEPKQMAVIENNTTDLKPFVTKPEGQRVPVIRRLESVEFAEREKKNAKVIFNPKSLQTITKESFDQYSLTYDYMRVAPLRTLCYRYLLENNLLLQPNSLQKICEQFICNNRQLFIIEEVRNEPARLQDLCQQVVNETNIIIDVNEFCIMEGDGMTKHAKQDEGRVFIIEESHGTIADLLRDNDDLDAGVVVIPDEVSEEHEIFLDTADNHGSMQVILENHSLSDSENEIYKKVEREIEKMMTTSSEDEDEGTRRTTEVLNEEELKNEFFSFVGDDCIQYEEVVPVNKEAYRRESLINDLREKYLSPKEESFTCRLKVLRKYVYGMRFIKSKEQTVVSKQYFFRKRSVCLQKKIEAIRSKPTLDSDSDSDSSSGYSVSSSSSYSTASCDTSSSFNSVSCSDNEEMARETETLDPQSSESLSEEASSDSRFIETNNNQLDVSKSAKPAHIESQQFAKEEDGNSNSSDSRSRNFLRRSPIHPPLTKKKKLSFEESLMNIEQMYKKSSSPSPSSTSSPNSSNSSSCNKTRRVSPISRPNVIINVNNNREAPRKLFIPSYKIFDQTLSTNEAISTVTARDSSRTHSRSSSSSSGSSGTRHANGTHRGSGFVRMNYPSKPSPVANSDNNKHGSSEDTNGSSSSQSHVLGTTSSTGVYLPIDHRIPYVRLERSDYVDRLAENYHRRHEQQQRKTIVRPRQRRRSTFS